MTEQTQRIIAVARLEGLSNTAATYLLAVIDEAEASDIDHRHDRERALERALEQIANLADLLRGSQLQTNADAAISPQARRILAAAADEATPDEASVLLLGLIDAAEEADTRKTRVRQQALEDLRSGTADLALILVEYGPGSAGTVTQL